QCVTKFRVLDFWIETFRVAPIHFHVIDTPLSIGFCVLYLMIQAPRALLAGKASGVGIKPEFQSFAVDVVGKRLHARGKAAGIGNKDSVSIPTDLPAIVNVDVLVAG